MTELLEQLRAELKAKIRTVREVRREQEQRNDCDHEWQRFKQTIATDNERSHVTAYFIVKGCPKCKRKDVIDYVVE